ncbi:hypothetical protein FEF22_000010 [Texas Phoenix palm phytoplasma]|uniref:Effector n=1 Tax=Texas Phoenix palm phytoplasma TaxID=176709 RepID=A0ABS5BHW1_9MOLU|nr:hypothetical protein [Texas Phoenix palm phytoplasma]MBP3059175.1 hypothetical protein [Texas Phoenix palm phytoplasma]
MNKKEFFLKSFNLFVFWFIIIIFYFNLSGIYAVKNDEKEDLIPLHDLSTIFKDGNINEVFSSNSNFSLTPSSSSTVTPINEENKGINSIINSDFVKNEKKEHSMIGWRARNDA